MIVKMPVSSLFEQIYFFQCDHCIKSCEVRSIIACIIMSAQTRQIMIFRWDFSFDWSFAVLLTGLIHRNSSFTKKENAIIEKSEKPWIQGNY